MQLNNSKMTFKIEPENAWGMIEGFHKKNEHYYVSIYAADPKAVSLRGNFKDYPKLLTKSKKSRDDFPPNRNIIDRNAVNNFQLKSRYVAVLDRIFLINNNIGIWNKLCNNGIFDIWDPRAPNNRLIDKEDPMILLLRIFEVDNDFSKDVIIQKTFWDKVQRTAPLQFIRPIIPKNKDDPISNNYKGIDYFDDIIKKIRSSLGESLIDVEKVRDTSSIPLRLS